MTRLAVIILNFNGTADTLACLASLIDQTRHAPHPELLVIDNGSTQGAAEPIRAGFPEIRLMELPENLGWAGGNNVGIREALTAGADWICLLNNDTVLPPCSLAALLATAERVGPCLLHPAIDYAGPGEGPQLDPGQVPTAPPARDLGNGLYELGHAYGACLMVSSGIFRTIGLLDERFFLQLEETDFWMRARAAGYRSYCDTNVRIVHAESRSFGHRVSPRKTYYSVRNSLLLASKHRAPGVLRSLRWSLIGLARRCGYRSLIAWIASNDPHAGAARAGVRDYASRRFGKGRQ